MLTKLQLCNQIIFKPRLNLFDVVCISVITQIAVVYGLLALLAFIPFIIISVYFENRLGFRQTN